MTPEDLDRILSSEDLLQPSSGFAMDVMAAARRQAAEPAPLPFPWFRLAAGLAASLVIAAAGTVLLLLYAPALATLTGPLAALGVFMPELGYATAAALVTLALVAVPRLLFRP
ncbi:MAG TPA: hypothetical protein VGF59_31615 [Bryobacteraceae bacterium]|jgi:hypothetical protein